jgi:quercetin dioxygenase-like cupin family protein
VLEVDAGCRLPWHTDSAEDTIAVLSGTAHVTPGDEVAEASPGGLVLVPAGVAHEVRSVGDETLRFVAFYAGTRVITRYRQRVEPDGATERSPVA